MGQKQKDQRALRRAKCVQKGQERLARLHALNVDSRELEEIRAAFLRGDCPLCGESGFKIIAMHCYKMHGIRTRELRELVGFTFTESICSPELSKRISERQSGINPRHGVDPDPRNRPWANYSQAGKEKILRSIRPWPHWKTLEQRREEGRRVGLSRKGKDPWNKTYEHGIYARYRRGCRCDSCVKAQREYWRDYRARRRLAAQ